MIHYQVILSEKLIHGFQNWNSYQISESQEVYNRVNVMKVSLHTFVDASQSAYGAAIYQRIEWKIIMLSVRLVAVKTKVAPILSISILRLQQWMGACLGNGLTQSVVFSIPVQDVVFGVIVQMCCGGLEAIVECLNHLWLTE